MANTLLQNKFNAEVIDSLAEIKRLNQSKKLNYTPTRFIQMLHKEHDNAFELVERLVSKDITTGLQELWRNKKLELSIEAIVIKPEYNGLFSVEIINTCKRKLKQLGYKN